MSLGLDRLAILIYPEGDWDIDSGVRGFGDDRGNVSWDVQWKGGGQSSECRNGEDDLAEGHVVYSSRMTDLVLNAQELSFGLMLRGLASKFEGFEEG